MRARLLLAAGATAGLAAAAVGAILLQDAIARFLITPKTPFQVAKEPAVPDYAASGRAAWLLWPEDGSEGVADVFYVHGTTYYSAAGWNAPIADPTVETVLRRLAVPNEVGPFLSVGRLYAPRYRQATLFAQFTHKFDGVAARERAYGDVRRAFDTYLASADTKRPLILVGYEQGGLHVLGLLGDYFQRDAALKKRLSVAYVLGQATPKSDFSTRLSQTPACDGPLAVRCVVSYVDVEARAQREIWRARDRSMIWNDDGDLVASKGLDLLCINPLTWTETTDHVDRAANIGAASATGIAFGATPPKIERAVGARCVDGILKTDRPRQDYLRRSAFLGRQWRARHFNLFYFDLAADAARRAANVSGLLAKEAQTLTPIDESVDIVASPIHKAPR